MTLEKARVPFTADQVASLNAYQISGFFHPFTCGGSDCHGIRLIADGDGWHCASQTCDYRQAWAHEFMADWSWNGGMARIATHGATEAGEATKGSGPAV